MFHWPNQAMPKQHPEAEGLQRTEGKKMRKKEDAGR